MEPTEVWRWQYTETEGANCGKQAISSWHMSAEDAKRYKNLAKHVREGRFLESPWQLVRFGNLQGVSDEDAVAVLAAWCKRQGFEMSFVTRQIGSVHVVCLVLKVKSPA